MRRIEKASSLPKYTTGKRGSTLGVVIDESSVGLTRSLLRGISSGGGGLCGGWRSTSARFCLTGCFRRQSGLLFRQLLAVALPNDASNVGLGFAIGRHAPVPRYALWAGVVSRQRLDHVVVVLLEQFAQIFRTALHIGGGIEGVDHTQLGGGLRHELHQALSAF